MRLLHCLLSWAVIVFSACVMALVAVDVWKILLAALALLAVLALQP